MLTPCCPEGLGGLLRVEGETQVAACIYDASQIFTAKTERTYRNRQMSNYSHLIYNLDFFCDAEPVLGAELSLKEHKAPQWIAKLHAETEERILRSKGQSPSVNNNEKNLIVLFPGRDL